MTTSLPANREIGRTRQSIRERTKKSGLREPNPVSQLRVKGKSRM